MQRRKLPIGIQNFREIVEEGHYDVDKSGFAVDLAPTGKYCFLSCPRRFGRSLFLDTLRELFEGNAVLFQGLPTLRPAVDNAYHPTVFTPSS